MTEHTITSELVVYHDPNGQRQVKFLTLTRHLDTDFREVPLPEWATREENNA